MGSGLKILLMCLLFSSLEVVLRSGFLITTAVATSRAIREYFASDKRNKALLVHIGSHGLNFLFEENQKF